MKPMYKNMSYDDLQCVIFDADDEYLVKELMRLSSLSNFVHRVIDEFGSYKWYMKVTDEFMDEIIKRMKSIGGFVRHD